MSKQGTTPFGAYIYELRRRRGWSLRTAAGHIGIHHSRLDEIEKGVDKGSGKPVEASYVNVAKIARAYGEPVDEMLRLAGHEPGIELEPEEWSLLASYRKLPREGQQALIEELKEQEARFGRES